MEWKASTPHKNPPLLLQVLVQIRPPLRRVGSTFTLLLQISKCMCIWRGTDGGIEVQVIAKRSSYELTRSLFASSKIRYICTNTQAGPCTHTHRGARQPHYIQRLKMANPLMQGVAPGLTHSKTRSTHCSASLFGLLHRTVPSCRMVRKGPNRRPNRTRACGPCPASCCSTSRIFATTSLRCDQGR